MRLVLIGLALVVLGLQAKLWFGEGSIPEVLQLREAVSEQEASNEQLRLRNQALQAEVDDLKTGLDAIEERARLEMGMVGEGETFFHIVTQPGQEP